MNHLLSRHAAERMAERRICYADIALAVRYGDVVRDENSVVYALHNMRRFSGDVFPSRLVALVQKRSTLIVVSTPNNIIKTVYWKLRGKNAVCEA